MSEMQTPESTSTALAIRAMLPSVIAADDSDLLGKLQAELAGFRADISTPAGRKAVASMAHRVARTKGDLLKLADRISEEARRTHKAIVGEKKVIEEKLDALRDAVRAPLDEYEAAEQARVKSNLDALAHLEGCTKFDGLPTPEIVRAAMAYAAEIANGRVWDIDFRARASDLAAEVNDKLRAMLAQAERREAEAAELAKLRAQQAERERQAAEEERRHREAELARKAAEAARVAAEQEAQRKLDEAEKAIALAQQQAQEAEEKAAAQAKQAAADKVAAEQQAKQAALEAAAEADRQSVRAAQKADYNRRMLQHVINCGLGFIDNQPQPLGILEHELTQKVKFNEDNFGDLLAEAISARDIALKAVRASLARARDEHDLAEAKRKQELEDKRRAENKAHRQRVNKAALDALILCGLTEEMAKVAIVAIARGDVPNVEIKY